MRKDFYDIIGEMNFNIIKEYETLLALFEEEKMPFWGMTLKKYIDTHYFRSLKFRGTYISLDDFMDDFDLNIPSNELNDLFVFCEFLIAILPKSKLSENMYLKNYAMVILGNINIILERTNHKLVNISSTENKIIIIENNKITSLASEITGDTNVSFDILEYNHHALKGDLDKKKKILTSIGLYIEPILKSRALQKSGYKQLESDAGFVFNNFHIRHNNKEGAKSQEYITKLNVSELEEWYDKAYEIALAVIIINNHLKVESKLAELKSNYKWKT